MNWMHQGPKHLGAQTRATGTRTPNPEVEESTRSMRPKKTLKQACFQGYPESAVYVQIPVGSRNSASHNAYHTSLRPSSLFEPRHPSLKVVRKLSNSLAVDAKENIQKHSDWSKTVTAGQKRKPTPNLPPPRPHEEKQIPKCDLTFGDSSEMKRCV